MSRRKTDRVQRREDMLAAFQQLNPANQIFALRYVEKLLDLQKLDELVKRVDEHRTNGDEACSFCGKAKEDVSFLMAAPANVYICDECVKLCAEILEKEKGTDDHDERG